MPAPAKRDAKGGAGLTMQPQSLAHCLDQLRRFDHDRYLCTLLLRGDARDAALAIYAFNVEIARVRETVREPLMGHVRLQWWRETIDGRRDPELRKHPVADALRGLVLERGLSPDQFEPLLAARERDLEDDPPASLAGLVDYARATSSTLLHLILRAARVESEEAGAAATHVGIAWALIGLIRAVPFHAAQARLFLPRDEMARFGLETSAPSRFSPGLAALVETIVVAAQQHLIAARRVRARVPAEARRVLMPAVLADHYIARLRRAGYNPFDARVQARSGLRAPTLAWAAARRRY